jgi:phosphoglycerate dehydrogenase-like enzyme
MGKIAVVSAVPGDLGRVRAIVQQGGHELVVVEHVAEADAADALLTRYKVTPQELGKLARCRIIGCTRTGVEIVPVDLATQHGMAAAPSRRSRHTDVMAWFYGDL